MDPNHKSWNERQKTLRQVLAAPGQHQQAIALFLTQHAMLHAAEMSQSGLWSFEDEVWEGLPAEALRRIPPRQEHSIAWLLWHITRIEDITMNLLVAGRPQLFRQDGWQPRLNISAADTGNATSEADIAALSKTIDLGALKAYRLAVGRSTRTIVQNLKSRGAEKQGRSGPACPNFGGRRSRAGRPGNYRLLGWSHHRRAALDAPHPSQPGSFE